MSARQTPFPIENDAANQAATDALHHQVNRRRFLTGVGMVSAAMAGAAAAGCGSTAPFVSAASQADIDIFNFALNLEYLEATFYSYIVTGKDLDAQYTGGGPAPTGAPAQISFATPQLADLFAEILFDETSHVAALRSVAGTLAIARPQLNLSALAAVTAANYIQIARLFEDVGVTAYTGAAGGLTTAVDITGVSQILAVEGFHSGALRLIAIQQNAAYPSTLPGYIPADGLDIIPADPGTVALSLAGPTTAKGGFFATQAPGTPGQSGSFNGFAFQRTASQVLSIVYGSATPGTAKGGFFPDGVNGNIKTV